MSKNGSARRVTPQPAPQCRKLLATPSRACARDLNGDLRSDKCKGSRRTMSRSQVGEPQESYNVQLNTCLVTTKVTRTHGNRHADIRLHSCDDASPGVTRSCCGKRKALEAFFGQEKGTFSFYYPPSLVLCGG